MKIFLDFFVFAVIISVIVYFAMFHERVSNTVYACSEVTKQDPIEVQEKCNRRR